jgi:hypothetical protein
MIHSIDMVSPSHSHTLQLSDLASFAPALIVLACDVDLVTGVQRLTDMWARARERVACNARRRLSQTMSSMRGELEECNGLNPMCNVK